MKKNNLDEMQEQKLLKLEHNGCWLAFWGLVTVMTVQSLLHFEPKAMAGEWIVFMALALYLCIGCLRNGIWDRHLKANGKTNLIVSALAALFIGIFTAVRVRVYATEPLDYLLSAAFSAGFTFVLCFAALSLCSALYKKRRAKLDQE